MVKIPKFSDLTDFDKIKQMGNDLADKASKTIGDTAKMKEMANKVKSTVTEKASEYTGQKNASAKDIPLAEFIDAIGKSMSDMYEAQKQQVAIMNNLKKQIQQLQHALANLDNQAEQQQDEVDDGDTETKD